jgi:hypothetical protein
MEPDAAKPLPDQDLLILAGALMELRDSLVSVSMALTDYVTEIPSPAKDEIVSEVERYLSRLRTAANGRFS